MFESTRREVRSMMDELLAAHEGLMHYAPEKKCICETCGCLIAPEFAVAGEKEIRQRKIERFDTFDGCYRFGGEDYIYTPYYCKAHAPKVKK